MLAATFGYERMCRTLIDNGAELNIRDQNGNTALHLAIQGFGDKELLVKLLLEHGTRTDIANDEGLTPVTLAKRLMHQPLISLLEESGKRYMNSDFQPAPEEVKEVPNFILN